MTDHYKAAEELIEVVDEVELTTDQLIALAQVHATLAAAPRPYQLVVKPGAMSKDEEKKFRDRLRDYARAHPFTNVTSTPPDDAKWERHG